ncbi:Maturase K [Frankliniella fusca]|uniref:Maturase K n=1 Tax=Frankliniella fusca TaxID=407009 RepID=A0AAE1HMB1_9NEOP|nr:Maturase K [Frankliniella fusca]
MFQYIARYMIEVYCVRKEKKLKKRWETIVEEYENELREYYNHVCNCCGKLCRQSQIKTLTRDVLEEKIFPQQFIQNVFHVDRTSKKFCKTCHHHILRGTISKLALCNGLEFPVVDKLLLKLNRLEERLLAARHVFQTLWTGMGPDGQYKTKGGIVNVPVDVDTSVNVLPRAMEDTHMIHVRLARKLEYQHNYMSGIVRPKLLYKAAKVLVNKPLFIEEGIKLSSSWSNNNFNEDNYEEDFLDNEFYSNTAIHETLLTSDTLGFNSLATASVRIAPAEGYTPISLLFDEKCEFLAFPTVFGGYHMTPTINNKPLSYSDFAKSITTRYDRRVAERAIMKTWQCESGPFNGHSILHSYYRIEFQQRGSSHAHMLLWLKDAPSFNIDSIESDQEICDFVDSIVTCSTDNLSDNLVKIQTHHHSHTCYKGRKNSQCRFNIPYYPMRCTTILRPLPEDFPGQQRKKI